jgi:hypothetical protein
LQVAAARAAPAITPTAATAAAAGPASLYAASPPTPSTVDIQQEVGRLIAAQNYDAAFTTALSSGKIPIVLFTCKQLDPRTLLSTPVAAHKLTSPVLLSLIQQLSFQLSPSDPDLKLVLLWLREAVASLPADDKLIAHHAPSVLRELSQKLQLSKAEIESTTAHPLYEQHRGLRQLVEILAKK